MVFEGFLELRINIDLVFIHLMKLYPFTQEHTMIGYRDNLYVFGGEVGFSNGVETPLWIYNITVRMKYIMYQQSLSFFKYDAIFMIISSTKY